VTISRIKRKAFSLWLLASKITSAMILISARDDHVHSDIIADDSLRDGLRALKADLVVRDGAGDRGFQLHLEAGTMILFSARDDHVRNIIIAASLLRDGLRAIGADLIVCDGAGDRVLMLHLEAGAMILFSARDDHVRNIIIAASLLRDGLRATGADLIVCDGANGRGLVLYIGALSMKKLSSNDNAVEVLFDDFRASRTNFVVLDESFGGRMLIRKAGAMILYTTLDNGIRLFRKDRFLALGTNLLRKSRSGRCPLRNRWARDRIDRGATFRTEFTVLARSTV